MKTRAIFASFLSLLCATPGWTQTSLPDSSLTAPAPNKVLLSGRCPNIHVNNRILARVNGKAISVLDLMKKMDVVFFRQYPDYVEIPAARYQFYTNNWKEVLREFMDRELVIADAAEHKMEVSIGDVRQEMEDTFGPNIVLSLDKLGLTYDEAFSIIRSDITIRRMMFTRVNIKAWSTVGPQQVRTAYQTYLKDTNKGDEWLYRVLSIRHSDTAKGRSIAENAHKLLSSNSATIDTVHEKLKEHDAIDENASVALSEEFRHDEKTVAPAYKTVLAELTTNSFSAPLAQQSRSDGSTVHRIIYLKEALRAQNTPFSKIENDLREQLMSDVIEVETDLYLNRLYKHYRLDRNGIASAVPEDFQPFSFSEPVNANIQALRTTPIP